MPRVESKNLFNFPLTGLYDDDVAKESAEMQQKMFQSKEGMEVMTKMMEALQKDDEKSNMEYVKIIRIFMDDIMKPMLDHPTYNESMEEIVEKEIKVPTNHDGKFDVPVFTYTPKKFQNEPKKQAAYIYAHGGGGVGIEATTYKPMLCHYAVELDAIIFNVDYRLAPETKCPNNVKDFYEVIRYVRENADSLGVDSNRIVIGGESGGGYICLGAMVLLAQNNEGDWVKLAMPNIPMVDDYTFTDTAAMTKEEKENNPGMRKCWKLIAADFEAQKDDPLLFPGKASDELLQKFPPTIVEESEFDMFITEATRLAYRLRAAGRLLEFMVIPGGKHGSAMNPRMKCFKTAMEARRLAFQHYVHN